MRPLYLWILALFVVAGLGTIWAGENQAEDIFVDEASAPDCSTCHDLSQLTTPKTDMDKGIREWMQQNGEGMTRTRSFVPTLSEYYIFKWPRRGHHPAFDPSMCTHCHPTQDNGVGHGSRIYSDDENTRCAMGCHPWLSSKVTSIGFTNWRGKQTIYVGTMRPDQLLTEVGNNAHSRIYQEGIHLTTNADITVKAIEPGCLGCHTVNGRDHGTLPACMDCHNFKGQSHRRHIALITTSRKAIDPSHSNVQPCAYCHGFEETSDNLYKSACYNCHLSGHQPLNKLRQAHFWR